MLAGCLPYYVPKVGIVVQCYSFAKRLGGKGGFWIGLEVVNFMTPHEACKHIEDINSLKHVLNSSIILDFVWVVQVDFLNQHFRCNHQLKNAFY